MKIQIESKLPSPEAFLTLRSDVGWDMPTPADAKSALDASLCGVIAIKNGSIIGMARAVGDGFLNIYIQDVVVAKSYRGQGIGRKLMTALIDDLIRTAPASCMIGLFAAENQDGFYAQFGLVPRPQTGFGPGMHSALSDLAKSRNAA